MDQDGFLGAYRVCKRHGWVDPTQTMFFEGKLSEER
jgi:hypothetical protein